MFDTWKVVKNIYNRRVYYHKDFCRMIIAHTFATSYHLVKDVNPLLRNVLSFMKCI